LINVIFIFLSVFYLILLIFGLVLCRKHSFTPGFYFFLILIILRLSPYIYSPLVHNYIDHIMNNGKIPMDMTIGEILAWFNLIPQIVEIIAYSILVIGLYTMWKSKRKGT